MIPLNNTTFTPAPAGVATGICIRVIDLGHQTSTFSGKTRDVRKICFGFELPEVLIEEGEQEGEPYIIYQRFTASMGPKSNLKPFVENWFSKKMTTDEQIKEFSMNMKKLLGQPAQLNIIHSEDGKYANIGTIMKFMGDRKALAKPKNELLYVSLDPSSFDKAAFLKLSQPFQDTIMKSPEWKVINGNVKDEHVQEDQESFEDNEPF